MMLPHSYGFVARIIRPSMTPASHAPVLRIPALRTPASRDEVRSPGAFSRLRTGQLPWTALCLLLLLLPSRLCLAALHPPTAPATGPHPQLVWIDTDIGDDLDDAFAIALLLRSPEVRVLGISTTFGDTELRARLLDHLLAASGVHGIPIYAGLPTSTTNLFTQRAYAEAIPQRSHPDAIAALLAAVHEHGSQLTLLAIGPLFNVAAAIDRDPETMHRLGRIVVMGGSIHHGYTTLDGHLTPPAAEWNILQDPPGAQTVLTSGIPIDLYPLDSTQIPLRISGRKRIFTAHTSFATPLRELYTEWLPHSWNHSPNPTLFDAVAASTLLDPMLCPTQPMALRVTPEGMTLPVTQPAHRTAPKSLSGSPHAGNPSPESPTGSPVAHIHVCLQSSPQAFLSLLEHRLTGPRPTF